MVCWDPSRVSLFLDRVQLVAEFENICFFGADQRVALVQGAGPVDKDEALRWVTSKLRKPFSYTLGPEAFPDA